MKKLKRPFEFMPLNISMRYVTATELATIQKPDGTEITYERTEFAHDRPSNPAATDADAARAAGPDPNEPADGCGAADGADDTITASERATIDSAIRDLCSRAPNDLAGGNGSACDLYRIHASSVQRANDCTLKCPHKYECEFYYGCIL